MAEQAARADALRPTAFARRSAPTLNFSFGALAERLQWKTSADRNGSVFAFGAFGSGRWGLARPEVDFDDRFLAT